MRSPRLLLHTVLACGLLLGVASSAHAQDNVTQTDIQRLQDNIRDVSRDYALSPQLQTDLDELRDEVAYFRVKLRRNEPVPRTEYYALRDKIDDLRAKARGGSTTAPVTSGSSPTTAAPRASDSGIPANQEIDVRLQQALTSKTAQPEDRFEATTVVDLRQGDRILIPAGATVRGVVRSVDKAGRVDRKGKLDLAFDQITIRGRAYPMRGTLTQAIESEGIKGDAGKIGAGAGVGAIIGGILGGFKGLLAGMVIGGGGVVAATEGQDAELPAGTVLRIRLDTPPTVR